MNNKGFTLIEILAVLVIMSILSVVGFAGVKGIQTSIKNKEYDAKVAMLESAAADYAETIYDQIKSGNTVKVTIRDLYLGGYIEADNDKCNSISCILADPRNESNHMCDVNVKLVNNRIQAKYIATC